MTMDKWDQRFLNVARNEVTTWSKDPEAQVGCVIVSPDRCQVTWGFNGFPQGIADTEERLNDRDTKLELSMHAELNAILNAGTDISGWTLYVTKAPCTECALAIIRKGIGRVVSPAPTIGSSWHHSQMRAQLLMYEANVICDFEGDQE